MRVTYLGHACFRIEGRNAEVVTDPFAGIGLPEPIASADLVLCSHSHRDHSSIGKTAKPDARVLVGFLGETSHAGVWVRGLPAYHDVEEGRTRGANTIHVFRVDGVVLCHLGDLGHTLQPDAVRRIGRVDVLFVPSGGFFTIGPKEASLLVDEISPAIAIPMHYRTPRHLPAFSRLSTVEEFANLREDVERLGGSSLEVELGGLPERTKTVILES